MDLWRTSILYSILLSLIGRNWNRAVSIMTDYGLDNRVTAARPAANPLGTGGSSPPPGGGGVKQLGHEANLSPKTSAKHGYMDIYNHFQYAFCNGFLLCHFPRSFSLAYGGAIHLFADPNVNQPTTLQCPRWLLQYGFLSLRYSLHCLNQSYIICFYIFSKNNYSDFYYFQAHLRILWTGLRYS
jgi:hypothetical protein